MPEHPLPSHVCAVCHTTFGGPVFVSSGEWSITSLCTVTKTKCEVYFCTACGHLQTPAIANIESYYDTEYRILIDSEDEDQLYRIVDNRKIFRLDHQAETLLTKLAPPSGATVLDYGCAKGGTLKRALTKRPDLRVLLFDVSEMYLSFWSNFLNQDQWAVYHPRTEWYGTCDIVTSFFSLEHVAEPRTMLTDIHRLLKPGGRIHVIVPDTYSNIADFVVNDHVNHFSPTSLATLFESCGFRTVSIDPHAHDSALVAIATRSEEPVAPQRRAGEIPTLAHQVKNIAEYWSSYAGRVRDFERFHMGQPAAVYGSGFYGTFLATCLSNANAVQCFVDQSPFRQGKTLLGKPIIAPDALPTDINTVYIGLNPARAKSEIAKVPSWSSRSLECFYP